MIMLIAKNELVLPVFGGTFIHLYLRKAGREASEEDDAEEDDEDDEEENMVLITAAHSAISLFSAYSPLLGL